MATNEKSIEAYRIRVLLRVRPPNEAEKKLLASGEYGYILRDEEKTPDPEQRIILDNTNKTYKFDRVLRHDTKQTTIFKAAAVPTLENVLSGCATHLLAQ